jgi:ABC-type dipeptide/oligopeptide/nickel transport system permease component
VIAYQYVARRAVAALVTILLIASMNFVLFRAIPGNAADAIACRGCTGAFRVEVQKELGLNQPLPEQYVTYIDNLAHGRLGYSLQTHAAVWPMIAPALLNTLYLIVVGVGFAIVIGVCGGVVAVRWRDTPVDRAAVFGSLAVYSLPSMWVGLILIIVFAGILPVAGATDPLAAITHPGMLSSLASRLTHVALPALTLGLSFVGQFLLVTRSAVLQTLGEDYVLTARAKGLTRRRIVWRYGLRNASQPIVALIAMSFGAVLGGTVLVETVFSYQGIGWMAFQAVTARDYPVLEAVFVVMALSVVLCNFCADLLAFKLDPRIRA